MGNRQVVRSVCASLFVVLVCGVALAAEEKPAPKNLVVNGDFEQGESGPGTKGKLPPGWRGRFVTSGPIEVVRETRPGSQGKQCLRIHPDEKLKSAGLYSALAPVDPTRPLLVGGWMKGGGMMKIPQGTYFGIGWYDADKKPIIIKKGAKMNYYYLHSGYKEDKWLERRVTYKPTDEIKETYKATEIPPNAAYFDIRIFALEYPRGGYFDDIFATQEIAPK